MASVRIGWPLSRLGSPEGDLCPEHTGETQRARGLREANHPVETVMVGDGQGFESEFGGLLGQFLGGGGTVEERERRMAVQFGVAMCTSTGPGYR